MHPIKTVTLLSVDLSDQTDGAFSLLQDNGPRAGKDFGGPGVEAGGRIVMTTATTAHVLVEDATGKVLHDATITVDTDIDPIPAGVMCPLTATATSVSAAGTLTVYWSVKK